MWARHLSSKWQALLNRPWMSTTEEWSSCVRWMRQRQKSTSISFWGVMRIGSMRTTKKRSSNTSLSKTLTKASWVWCIYYSCTWRRMTTRWPQRLSNSLRRATCSKSSRQSTLTSTSRQSTSWLSTCTSNRGSKRLWKSWRTYRLTQPITMIKGLRGLPWCMTFLGAWLTAKTSSTTINRLWICLIQLASGRWYARASLLACCSPRLRYMKCRWTWAIKRKHAWQLRQLRNWSKASLFHKRNTWTSHM